MVIDFSTIGVVKEQPTLVLCNADGKAIQTLGYTKELKANICYNEMSTITFDIPAYVDGIKTPHYDEIIGMRIIDMIGWGRFILINPSLKNDGVKEIKSCKAYSLEYELTYKKFFLEESTYSLWNPLSPDDTILGMIMAELPSWNVGVVDDDLINKYRTLSSDNTNIYNFIKSTLQQLYGCIFDFDTYTRTINVRSTANEAVSKPIYLSMDNLVKEIQIDEDTESIVTALDVCGGEDVDIRSVNPMGTNMIYNLDYFMNTTQFDQSLIDKWNSWKQSFEANQLTYYNISIERMLKTSAILTEQAALSDLKNIKLASLENERSVYVEYLAQHTDKSSKDYSDFQAKLKDVNKRISKVKDEIATQEEIIDTLKESESELADKLIAIQKRVAFDKFFTQDELIIIDRYFKEESIEESSFVVAEVDSYSDSDISNSISNVRVSFTNTKFAKVTTDSGKVMYTVDGGNINIASEATALSAKVVSACLERNDDETMVLSVFLNKGTIGEASFPSGCISITGKASPISNSGSTGISFTISTGNMYFTRNTTDYEKHSVSWDLFEYGKQTLRSLAYPSYTFSVSSANFMTIDDFIGFIKQLELGQKIYLNTDNSVLQPIFIGLDIDFENLSSLSLQFSDKYSSSDSSFKLVELLDQSISMGKTVDANKMSYAAFVDSGASTMVKEFMDSALDVAKNAILSSSGQGASWDETGLHLRKYIDSNIPSAGYEDEQIWMINNSIVFTDDNWQTAKMAIGKIIDENIAKFPETADKVFDESKTYYYMDDNGQYQVWNGTENDWADRPLLYEKDITAYGIVAPYIVGTILAGQNLIITTEDGSFRVDSSGVHIDSMKLFITQDSSSYDTTLGDKLKELTDADDKTAGDLSDAIERINGLDDKIENTVTTYYQDSIPTDAREGDLWYVTGDCYGETEEEVYLQGKLFRYNGKSWDEITDADAISAIEKANQAQATADGKIVTYYQNYTPYLPTVGDLWFNTAASKTVTRYIEPGDDLSGVTISFDTTQIIDTLSGTDHIITSENGNIYAEPDYIVSLFDASSSDTPKYDGVMMALQIGNMRLTEIFNKKWYMEALTVPTTFGVVTSVNKSSPFYNLITASFTSKYEPKKLYRFDGESWKLVEDGDIETIKQDVSDINKTLGDYITEEGYLTANKLKGAISTALSTMQNGKGNVLFDDKGIWLMNTATKETATSAIWMNEKGILFGTGVRGYIDADADEENAWKWTTAIGHDGIIADAMATKVLSAFTIKGGSIDIGNGNFTVDTNGNLVAKSGTFSGTLKATKLEGNIRGATDSDSWLIGCGISIGQGADETGGNFYVDTDGNVTMKGNINMSEGKITWSSINSPVQAQYSADGISWHTTFQTTDYYVRYSYDGGVTWTEAIQARGQKGDTGEKGDTGARGPRGYAGEDGSDADVTFANVNAALGLLFKTYLGGTPTTIDSAYIYSPQVKGGKFYGGAFYAGSGSGYSQMTSAGFNIYDSSGNKKLGLGCYDGRWSYPYLSLGVGTGESSNGSGIVMKLGNGIWVGESSILVAGGSYPGGRSSVVNISSSYPNATGIFIDFASDKVYRYYEGVPSEIGEGGSKTATFG